jgi:hypothetical protein
MDNSASHTFWPAACTSPLEGRLVSWPAWGYGTDPVLLHVRCSECGRCCLAARLAMCVAQPLFSEADSEVPSALPVAQACALGARLTLCAAASGLYYDNVRGVSKGIPTPSQRHLTPDPQMTVSQADGELASDVVRVKSTPLAHCFDRILKCTLGIWQPSAQLSFRAAGDASV